MKEYAIGILGATGAVGREMLAILAERSFPAKTVRLFASSRSAGRKVLTDRWGELTIEEASDRSFEGLDLVLGAADNAASRRFAPAIKAAGALYVDNASAFRLDPEVPLVVPEINPEDVKEHHGIIANPNCSTIITLVAIQAIHRLSKITSITASTYQAVSGAGAAGPKTLFAETEAALRGLHPKDDAYPALEPFPYPIAFNLIPQIGGFQENGYTAEEMKLQNEGRKILHLPELAVSCTCVRVPVERSHAISACIVTEDPLELSEVAMAVAKAPGCRLVDIPSENIYPMPLETSYQDLVFVGRIRKDLVHPNGISLWCCGDQVRKGAATNAVQIAELALGIYE